MKKRLSNPKDARNYMRNKVDLLEKASGHIYYEIKMFYGAYIFFKKKINYPPDKLELFLLHTRNLFDFFYPPESIYSGDMCVFDFLDSADGFNSNKTTREDINFDRVNVNKLLSHLTYKRCSFDYKIWPCIDICEKMIKTIEAFYAALPDNYKNWQSFCDLNNLLLQNLANL